ncbi:MAG: TRAP transporter substrate-binding protein [Devosiaceae bacterium]|nr:TRAP transporter substrate-binding protein [Devosiaceae bacterium MH13]
MKTLAGACALMWTCTAAQSAEFRIGMLTPPSHVWTQSANQFAEELAEASGGEHSVTVFPGAQLGNEAQMLQLLQSGALDFAILTAAEVSNRAPTFGAFFAPFLADDIAHAGAILRSPEAVALLDTLPQEVGVVGVGYGMAGLRQIVSTQELDDVGDLSGLKVRITPVEPILDFYSAMGTAPTPMPLPAVFDALANGQVDAIDMDAELIWKLRYFEHAETVAISDHMMFPMIGLISGRVWAGLSEDDRAMISELLAAAVDRCIDEYIAQEEGWIDEVRGTGVTVTTLDRDFFTEAADAWDATWTARVPEPIADLRAAAERLR